MSVMSPGRRNRRIAKAGGKESDVKDRLASAAAGVFARSGYHASRISDIVRGAGVAQGTFYLYFENKEAVLLELVDRFCAGVLAETLGTQDRHGARTPEDVAVQVRSMSRTIIVRCRERPDLARAVVVEARASTPAVRELMRGIDEQVANGAATYLAAAAERGLVRPFDPRLAGRLILGIVH